MVTFLASAQAALQVEWLETNGLGGYASSTPLNCNTRRYHGLLVAQLAQPAGKYVLLSTVEDSIEVAGKTYSLSGDAYTYLEHFSHYPHPVFEYMCGNVRLRKEIVLLPKRNTVVLKYTLLEGLPTTTLRIRPFLAYRNFHTLTKANDAIGHSIKPCSSGVCIGVYPGMPALYLQANQGLTLQGKPQWRRDFAYAQERERGFEWQEDLWTPGESVFQLRSDIEWRCGLEEAEGDYHFSSSEQAATFERHVEKSAAQFIFQKPSGVTSIVAGYHWFFDWGRDAMIALPALTLQQGKPDIALEVLTYFAAQQRDGLIPNYIDPKAGNQYDAVDASLWFVWACQQYAIHTGDKQRIATLFGENITAMYAHFTKGTLFDVHVGDDGLLYAGNAHIKITWMDAVVNGIPITPRNGAQVEVNALWYNALCFIAELGLAKTSSTAERLHDSFVRTFWSDDRGYLLDYVNAEHADASIRPNQIIALALPHTMLTISQGRRIIDIVKSHLLTPYGLRTLSPQDPRYQGRYEGTPAQRDAQYHMGTVWPWLLAPFADALRRVASSEAEISATLQPCLRALKEHVLTQAGLGSVSELFDGDAPHRPNGCISQAWSVAALLRVILLTKTVATK